MHVSLKLIAIGAITTFASLGALAQNSDGGDYRPMQLNSPPNPEVQKGAMEAARTHGGAGAEAPGSSSAMTNNGNADANEVQKGAMAAAKSHGGAGAESTGSSTAAPGGSGG
ncbi:hypothetical protein QTI66_30755 [Variovorax sp. J22R133]|uniref:hypothetical protein n=1 Tax=Variovorax brevis TaxID=3053503 RepID=UPI0025751A7B|nr:hypothetical protein [Variovorax sp. J22R133]MDM0116530.1 hypothetical protein [Variovorax sp. J22R133]